jgi:anti-sigma B factor antagonist
MYFQLKIQMSISSRTPEGESNRCPVCSNTVRIEPSKDTRDAPCPHCGHLLWFDCTFMHVKIDATDGLTAVRFTHKHIDETFDINLFRLVDELGQRNFRLDFSGVLTITSAVLGKLITLHRKLKSVQGKLILCGVSKEILEVISICKLDRILMIEAE